MKKLNFRVIQLIISHGSAMFGDTCRMREAMKRAQTTWCVSEHYMSKVRSTLKQFVRDWSNEGYFFFDRILLKFREGLWGFTLNSSSGIPPLKIPTAVLGSHNACNIESEASFSSNDISQSVVK